MPNTHRSTWLPSVCLAAVLVVLPCVAIGATSTPAPGGAPTGGAGTASASAQVPVLLVDAGLGDAPVYMERWLGKGPEMVATAPGASLRLWRGSRPVWWGAGSAPPTFLLASTSDTGAPVPGSTSADDIAWALDRVAEISGQPKSVIVAQGAAGLQARAYLQDLASARVSRRGDVVGLVQLGSPNNGLTLAKRYPSMDVWLAVASGAGLTVADLMPGSPWLARLDAAASLPGAVRVAVVRGRTAEIANRASDGVVIPEDSTFPTGAVTTEVEYSDVKARASDGWPLAKTWERKAPRSGATTDTVKDAEVDKLGPVNGYAGEPAVAATVRRLLESWFAAGVPTTYVSTRLVVDTSGSMAQGWSGTTKIDGARRAAGEFATAMKARLSLPGATPEDLGLLTFSTKPVATVRPGSDPSAIAPALARIVPKGNTDMASAIQAAIDAFKDTPRSADKVVLLLSDGVNTEGLDDKAVLAGPVARAAQQGIRIEAIAIGGVGTMDASFLKSITSATGGAYHTAKDLFELRRGFVRARYAGRGALAADKLLQAGGGEQRVSLGALGDGATRLEFALVPDGPGTQWTLMRDRKPVAQDLLDASVTDDGTQIVMLRSPARGAYELVIGPGAPKRLQVFALADTAVLVTKTTTALPDSSGAMMLYALAGLGVLALCITVAVGIASRRRGAQAAPEETFEFTGGTEEE